jgi:hypothetical protein
MFSRTITSFGFIVSPMEARMPKLFVEPRGEMYVVLKNHRVQAKARTQEKAIEKAHALDPEADIKAARVRTTEHGKPDQWREV